MIIRGDRNVAFQAIVSVMDLVLNLRCRRTRSRPKTRRHVTPPIAKRPNLLALDVALVLFGMLVMALVLKLLRVGRSRPDAHALTYLLGVPTVLIALSMITRVSDQ